MITKDELDQTNILIDFSVHRTNSINQMSAFYW